MNVHQISVLLCPHHSKDKLRADCQACRRAIYRSIKAIKEKEQKEKSLDIIDRFEDIPEIQSFREFMKAKGITARGLKTHINKLKTMWTWVRESGNESLVQTQRPALWDIQHCQYILAKVKDRRVSRYCWVQTLRRLFESQDRNGLLKQSLLKARRKDMRSPNGRRRKRLKDYATTQEFQEMLGACDSDYERLKLKVHVTLKCREGSYEEHRERGASFCNLRWERVNWHDTYYGNPSMVTATVFETKTGGGTLWEHCPLNLYWHSLEKEFKEYWERQGSPKEGFVWGQDTYKEYLSLFEKIGERTGLDLTPHDMRSTGATWLRDQGASDLAIGQYDARTGRAIGFGGVGWENAEIFYQRYGRLTRQGIKKLWSYVHREIGANGDSNHV